MPILELIHPINKFSIQTIGDPPKQIGEIVECGRRLARTLTSRLICVEFAHRAG